MKCIVMEKIMMQKILMIVVFNVVFETRNLSLCYGV